MSGNEEVSGATAEVFPDFSTGKSVSRFFHPETGEVVVELYLDPETARDYAFNLTRSSIAIEEHQNPRT